MVIVQQGPLLAMFQFVTHVVLFERNKKRGEEEGDGRTEEKY